MAYDQESSLTNVQTLLNDFTTDNESILKLYLTRAANFVLDYCNITEIPDGIVDVVEDITVIKYRLNGVEGISTESKGSMSESYISSIPQDMLNRLNKYRRLRFPS